VRVITDEKGKSLPVLTFYLLLCVLCFLSGCSVVEYAWPEGPPHERELYESYNRTELKTSSSYDVLTAMPKPQYEVLSQSKSVIASLVQKKKGHKTWFNMVAFDEDRLTAKRKYIFIVDDMPNPLEEPKKSLSFDSEMVLEPEALDKPYANENARRIAILKQVLENVRKDFREVGSDNKMLHICGMMVNQAFEAVLVKLDTSPALASKLSEPAGVEFSHMSLDKGRIQMLVQDDITKVKLGLGAPAKHFAERRTTDKGESL